MIEPLFAFEIVKEGFGGCVRVAFLVGKVAAMFGVGDSHQHLRGRAPFPLVYDLHRAQKILGIITTACFDGIMKTKTTLGDTSVIGMYVFIVLVYNCL